MVTVLELFKMYEMAVSLEEAGRSKEAYSAYTNIIAESNCPKQLMMTVEKALARLQSKLPPSTIEQEPTVVSEEDDVVDVDPFILEELPSIANKMPISDKDFDRMKEDIKERGVQIPLIVLPNFKILCGYNRWKIAKELGLKSIPIIYRDVPSDKRFEFALKDNIMRRQLSADQIVEFILDISTKKVGRPAKNSHEKVEEEVADILGVSTRTIQRAKAFARKVKENPELRGKTIQSVMEDDTSMKHKIFKYEYTIGVNDDRMADDLVEVVDKIFDFDLHGGDKIKLSVQAYHIMRK